MVSSAIVGLCEASHSEDGDPEPVANAYRSSLGGISRIGAMFEKGFTIGCISSWWLLGLEYQPLATHKRHINKRPWPTNPGLILYLQGPTTKQGHESGSSSFFHFGPKAGPPHRAVGHREVLVLRRGEGRARVEGQEAYEPSGHKRASAR